jgi:hypothetical protein
MEIRLLGTLRKRMLTLPKYLQKILMEDLEGTVEGRLRVLEGTLEGPTRDPRGTWKGRGGDKS